MASVTLLIPGLADGTEGIFFWLGVVLLSDSTVQKYCWFGMIVTQVVCMMVSF